MRERRDDVPILASALLERYRAKHAREVESITPEAYRRLLAYPWPGNVRELQHAIERAVLVARGIPPSEVPSGSLEEIERPTLYSKMRKHGIPQRRGWRRAGLPTP